MPKLFLTCTGKAKRSFIRQPQWMRISRTAWMCMTYVTEQRRIEKEKANADSSDEEEAPHDKSAPKTPLPISNKAFGKRKGKLGRNPANSGAKKPHKPPPRRNLRKEQALAAHSKAGTLPVQGTGRKTGGSYDRTNRHRRRGEKRRLRKETSECSDFRFALTRMKVISALLVQLMILLLLK